MMKYSESLKKTRDFQAVYQKGKSAGNRCLVMYVRRNEAEETPEHQKKNRLGISVSKKVGNSVVRHRITRLIRESYRLNEEKFVRGYDIVVIGRPGAKGRSFLEMESALLHLAGKHHLMAAEKEMA